MSSDEMRCRLVAALLAWQGMDAGDLADHLGLARQTIYKKMTGRRAFTTRDLELIADTFGIDPGLLIRPRGAEAVLGAVRPAVRPADEDLLRCT